MYWLHVFTIITYLITKSVLPFHIVSMVALHSSTLRKPTYYESLLNAMWAKLLRDKNASLLSQYLIPIDIYFVIKGWGIVKP